MAAYWLSVGRSADEIVDDLVHHHRLSADQAQGALAQARRWLTTGDGR